ncbi:MAG: amidohydrolase [Burkholderiales bacterium]|nr:amidohydrolase [Burkholderiales bacterium]
MNRYRAWCPHCLDFHAHFLHPGVYERCAPHSVATCFGTQPLTSKGPRFERLIDPHLQILDMDAQGIAASVISSADVVQSRSWAEPAEEALLAAQVNDMAADWVARFPGRFIGSAVVPLGDMRLAMRELERALAMGLRIVNLPSNHRGQYLGESRYAELWAAVHERGLVAFIHPDGVRDPWFQEYALWNSIGQSIEEVKVMSSLIYEGVLERHRGVKTVMAHGGGYMPYYMGRLDRNVAFRPSTARNLSKLPSEYLADFHYDSCVYDPRTLENLVERVGAQRVVLGGDDPFADVTALALLESAARLSDEQRGWIAGGTAARLLEGLLPREAARNA